jgi:hypothetical protein
MPNALTPPTGTDALNSAVCSINPDARASPRLAMIACDKKPPSPPTAETITGNERSGWDQLVADAVELAAIGYVVYVDGARTVLAGVTCADASAGAGFPCTARVPALTAGTHTLERFRDVSGRWAIAWCCSMA